MPYIEERRNAYGEITSYRIVVSAGMDYNGKQIRRRTIWTPPRYGMSEYQMKKEATAAAYKFEEQINQGYQLDNNQTFAQYAQYVLDLKERTGVKPTTIDRYIDMLPRINEQIGHLKLNKIRPQHLNELYKNLAESARQDNMRAVAKKTLNITLKRSKLPKAEIARRANVAASTITAVTRGDPVRLSTAEAIAEALGSDLKSLFTITNDSTPLSNKTILEHHRLISTILSQADKELLIPFNPAAKATPPKVQKSSPDYYQPEEMDLILDALENAPIRWKAITYLLIDTGCRRGEIMGLKWSKVDLDTGLIIIDCALLYTESKGIYEGPTKTNDFRAMKLAPQSLAVLKEWQKEYENLKELNGDRWENSPYVFVRDNGAPLHPDSITRWQSNFSKKHDIPPIHPHAFRHTAASTMIANGVDIVTTATELGHASPTTTANMYAHQIAVARAKAADVRAGVFANRK